MTVSSLIPVNNYEGNSSNKKFDFDFLIEKSSELVVEFVSQEGKSSVLKEGIDYSINEIGNKEGSFITFPLDSSKYGILKPKEFISLKLDLVIKQETEFKNSTYFNFTTLEWVFDYIIRILQIMNRKLEKCFKVKETSDVSPDKLLEDMLLSGDKTIETSQYIEKMKEAITKSIASFELKFKEFGETFQDCMKQILNAGDVSRKTNPDLSNLTAEGEKHFLNYTQVANCITEIPNRIKYELSNDGTLTLKAGSIVIVPYGTENLTSQFPKGAKFISNNFIVYDTEYSGEGNFFVWAELTKDYSLAYDNTTTALTTMFIRLNEAPFFTRLTGMTFSGSKDEQLSTTMHAFYNTVENKIHAYSTTGEVKEVFAFPIMLLHGDGKKLYSFIDQVFNGFGYIGSTVWADKGIKFICGDGKNEDGSLRNIEQTTIKLCIRTNPQGSKLSWFRLSKDKIIDMLKNTYYEQETKPATTYSLWYNTETNETKINNSINTNWGSIKAIYAITAQADTTGKITSFKPQKIIRLDDTVKRTGDTMSGRLTILTQGNADIILRTKSIDYSESNILPANTRIGGVIIQDKNEQTTGRFENYIDTSGNLILNSNIQRLVDGQIKTLRMGGFIKPNGDLYTFAPTPSNYANSTEIATAAFVKSVLSTSGTGFSTFKKAQNGYIKLANGIIIQWGNTAIFTHNNQTQVITLPTAFTNTTFCVTIGILGNTNSDDNIFTTAKTTTNFTLWSTTVGGNDGTWNLVVDWMAIGY